MKKSELQRKLACLETINDFLITDRERINDLMKTVGFANGLETLKKTAEEMIAKGYVEVPECYN